MNHAVKKIELLAPGGDVEAIKAAIVAGANAVYCGLDHFNARNRAKNLSFDDLIGVIRLAHTHDCEIFLTLNVVILEQEIPTLFNFLNRLVNTRIDGIIVQDLGLFSLVKKYFPSLDIHASTQLTTVNEGQVLFLAKVGASRLNLSRELNLAEIKDLTNIAHQHNMLTEVFVHGALCIAFSGQCYSSSVSVGNSGNRGRCSQACRDEYELTPAGNNFPLNLKDNSAYFDLPELVEAGVDSLKVEGRIKGAHYVYTVIDSWRKNIDGFIKKGALNTNKDAEANIHKVFNRDFTNSFLQGDLTKDMFIDNPRDNSVNYAIEKSKAVTEVKIQAVKDNLYADKNALGSELATKIKGLSIEKQKLTLTFSGQLGEPLTVTVSIKNQNTNDKNTFSTQSESKLIAGNNHTLDFSEIEKRFKKANSGFVVEEYDFSQVDASSFLPFKEISQLKNKVAYWLNESNNVVPHVEIPTLKSHPKLNEVPTLSILISDEKDAYLCDVTDADVYFKLPESFKVGSPKLIEIFKRNPQLIPWFPAVLIGKDYHEALRTLTELQPKRIVSNNTGIAYKASKMGIEWIAGPFLNTTNSYALQTLQEELNCAGAFISNEINKLQIRKIKRPKNFKLLYSIYHPILMMTSRQCFFQQTVGCNKPSIEDGCMLKCKKATTITNVKGVSFAVDKQRGGYPSIYNDEQFLNTEIVRDLADLFDEFFIDLTDIGAGSKPAQDKVTLIQLFESLLNGDDGEAEFELMDRISKTTSAQYVQGL